MTLWNANQVDLVAKSPTGEATLFMVEERPWGEDPQQADQLLAKVNTYYHYVMDGRVGSDFPSLEGLPVVVRLECATEPPDDIQRVIDAAVAGFGGHGIGFTTVVSPALRSSS